MPRKPNYQEETMGHIDNPTGRNKRDKSPIRTRNTGSRGGGIKRWDGKPVESRAAFRRRQKTGRG
jgi:hypothetical protein